MFQKSGSKVKPDKIDLWVRGTCSFQINIYFDRHFFMAQKKYFKISRKVDEGEAAGNAMELQYAY